MVFLVNRRGCGFLVRRVMSVHFNNILDRDFILLVCWMRVGGFPVPVREAQLTLWPPA